jgi:hypothetical protein
MGGAAPLPDHQAVYIQSDASSRYADFRGGPAFYRTPSARDGVARRPIV